MSQTIDEKVVELRFDNKQFEDGVKESLTTFEKLKNAIKTNISSKSFDDVQKSVKNIDLSELERGVESLSNRFSTFGIVGMEVIRNITDGLIGGLTKGIHAATDAIVSGGIRRAMNIENAHFQLQGLIDDEKEVQAIMDDAMDSVDGTAYAYDEAAKAASMFAASGLKSGTQMQQALKAIAGVSATTNSEYQGMADIFTKIAGQGKVMTNELNQFAARGMNAAAATTKFINGVNDGSVEATEGVKKYIKTLTNGRQITEADLREMVTKSKISFELFSEAMATTFGDHAKDANKTFTGSMANIRAALARTGAMFVSPLVKQDGPFVQFFNAVRIKVNEFNKALGMTNGIADKFTKWINGIVTKLTGLVEGFKVANLVTQKWGDGTTRVFETTEYAIQKWGDGTETVFKKKVYTPFSIFRDIIYSIVNIFKGLGSVIKPVIEAFREVFSFDGQGLGAAAENLRKFTESLKLSEKHANSVKKLFTGLFKVISSIIRLFGRLVNAIRPNTVELGDMSDGFFDVLENVGELLEKFSTFIDESPYVTNAIEAIGKAVNWLKDGFVYIFGVVKSGFTNFNITDILNKVAKGFDNLRQSIFDALPKWVQDDLLKIEEVFKKLVDDISILDFSAISADFKSLGEIMDDFKEKVLSLEDLKMKIVNFFDFSNEESGINKIINKGKEFVDWYNKTIAPTFDNVTVGGAAAAGGMGYIVYQIGSLFGAISSFIKGGGKTLTELPKTLKSIRKALNAYTTDLKTQNIERIAKAILILAAAIFVLALIKPERLLPAVIAIGVCGVILIGALAVLKLVGSRAMSIADVLNTAAKNLTSSLKNFAKSLVIKELGKTALRFVAAIGLLILEFMVVAELVKRDDGSFTSAIIIVMSLLAGLIILSLEMSELGNKMKGGMAQFGIAMAGVLALALAVGVLVWAMNKIMNMWIPHDWPKRLGVFGAIIVGVAALILAYAWANKIAGKNSSFIKFARNKKGGSLERESSGMSSIPLLSMIGLIAISVWAVKQLMEMQLPDDYKKKLWILAGIFTAVASLILIVGIANNFAGKAGLKGFGVMLGICLFIGVVLGALKILENFNAVKLRKGVLALGTILFALAFTLAGAGKITNAGAGLAVLGMAFLVGAIVMALLILPMIETKHLIKGAVALGSLLLVLAFTFAGVGKITNGNSWKPVAAMAGMVAVIAGALWFLAKADFKGMLAGAVSLGLVLVALTYAFRQISGSNADPKRMLKKVGLFLLLGLSLLEVVFALAILANFDWKNILAGGVALAGVLLAYVVAFNSMKGAKISLEMVGNFLLGALSTVVIAGALYLAAQQPWKQILAAGAAISLCLLALSAAFAILNSVPRISGESIGAIIIGALACAVIGVTLYIAAQQPWKQILAAAAAISMCMIAIGVAMSAMTAVGAEMGWGILASAAMVIAGAIACAIIGWALSKAANHDWKQLLGAAGAISICLLAIGVAMSIMTAVGTAAVTSAAGLGVVAAGIMIVAAIIAIQKIAEAVSSLAMQNPENVMASAKAISMVLLSIAVAMAICTLIGTIAPAAVAGIGIIDAFIVDMTFLVQKIGELADLDAIKSGGEKLSAVGDAIGGFFTGIINGIGEGVAQSIERIGTSLTNFMTNASGFFDGLRNIDPNMVESAKALAGVVLALSAAEFISGITNLIGVFTGPLLGTDGGFTDKLVAFGKAISDFDEATADVKNPYKFKAIAEGCGYLIDMSKKLPNSGGLLGDIMGNNDMDKWGKELVKLGAGVLTFSLQIAALTDDAIAKFKPFADGIQPLIDMSKNMPNTGGMLGDILGNNDMDEWGGQLSILGKKITSFAINIAGLNDQHFEKFSKFSDAVGTIIEMSKKIGNSGGMVSWFTGDNDPAKFGESLVAFGKSIASFAKETAIVVPERVSSVASSIGDLITSLSSIGDFKYTGGMKSFGDELADLSGKGLSSFVEAFDKDAPNATAAVQRFVNACLLALTQKYSEFGQVGIESGARYLGGIESKYGPAYNYGYKLGSQVLAALRVLYTQFKQVGTTSGQQYGQGLHAAAKYVIDIAKALAMDAYKNLNPKDEKGQSLFYKAGQDAGQGYVDGIRSKKDNAKQAGKEIAAESQEGTKTENDSHSPSKEFYKLGSYGGQGYVNALHEWAKEAYNAGKELAAASQAGIGMDDMSEPIIRPVVDLENVFDAANTVNQLFSSAVMSTMTRTNAASTSMVAGAANNVDEKFQNGQNPLGNNYTFNQYNTSPKALSRIEIYRDTKSLMQSYREAVERA